MKSILKYSIFLLIAAFVLFSCEKDDYTGDSKLNPSNPALSIEGVDANGYNFVEKDTVITFNILLSEPQIVDVQLTVKQIAGDATVGEDYSVVNSGSEVVIPAYSTSAKLTIKIMRDDIAESVESFTLQIGDQGTANASLTPVNAAFTIGNYTEDPLILDMSWTTDIATTIGIEADPEDVVGIDLLIFDKSDNSPVDTVKGVGFKTYDGFEALADGEYIIAAAVFGSAYAGDFDADFNIDLELVFNQTGIINAQTLNFAKVFNDRVNACYDYRANLAVVKKTGNSYEITKELVYLPEIISWNGPDTEWEYESQVTTYFACNTLFIQGLGFEWLEDFWGEEIIASTYIAYTVDNLGNITIPEQDYVVTLYNGNEYLYQISGTGVLDETGTYPVMDVSYDLIQDGSSIIEWCFLNEYSSTRYLTGTFTTEPTAPATKKAVSKKAIDKSDLIRKPYKR